jgi:hypothetical protein
VGVARGVSEFFEASPDIAQMMQEIGVTSEPEITFWNELDTIDTF